MWGRKWADHSLHDVTNSRRHGVRHPHRCVRKISPLLSIHREWKTVSTRPPQDQPTTAGWANACWVVTSPCHCKNNNLASMCCTYHVKARLWRAGEDRDGYWPVYDAIRVFAARSRRETLTACNHSFPYEYNASHPLPEEEIYCQSGLGALA